MLSALPIDIMLLATDLQASRTFYEDKVGLEVLIADDQFVTFGCGGDSRLVITASTRGTADAATQASWRVDDLAAEVADLRARGVKVLDFPDMGSKDGIVDAGFALAAWFADPGNNLLGLLQFKS